MPQKLTESSTAVFLLRQKPSADEFNLTDNPKTVWSSKVFMEHKLDNFRSTFNLIRTEEQEKTGKAIQILIDYSMSILNTTVVNF